MIKVVDGSAVSPALRTARLRDPQRVQRLIGILLWLGLLVTLLASEAVNRRRFREPRRRPRLLCSRYARVS